MLIPVCAPSNLIVSICISPHIGYRDSGRRNTRHVEILACIVPYLPIPTTDIGRREAMWCGVYAFTP